MPDSIASLVAFWNMLNIFTLASVISTRCQALEYIHEKYNKKTILLGHEPVANSLIQRGANVNIMNIHGKSALHLAAEHGDRNELFLGQIDYY